MCQCIIYKVTNLINGKIYIGQTINKFVKRKTHHICLSKKLRENDGTTKGTYFHNAINKYGEENFKWEIIFECNDLLILNVMETFKIMVCHSHVSEGGYNLTWGGDGTFGRPCSEKTKEKIRQTQIGKHLTDETRLKMSISQQNRPPISEELRMKRRMFRHSDETKVKMSENKKGSLNGFYGKKHTDETKDRWKNRPVWNKGIPRSEETKQKIRETKARNKLLKIQYNQDVSVVL